LYLLPCGAVHREAINDARHRYSFAPSTSVFRLQGVPPRGDGNTMPVFELQCTLTMQQHLKRSVKHVGMLPSTSHRESSVES
jgi:hypothetical protein